MSSFFASLAASTKRTFAGVRTRATATSTTASTSTTSTSLEVTSFPRETSLLSQYNADLSFGECDARFNFEQCLAAAVATADFVEAEDEQLGEAVFEGADDSHIVRSIRPTEDVEYKMIDEHDFFAGPFEFLLRRESTESVVSIASVGTAASQLSPHATSLEYHLAFYNANNNSLDSSVSGSSTSLTTSDDVSAPFVTPPSSIERCSIASTSTKSSCTSAPLKVTNRRICTACRAQEGSYDFEWQKPLYLLPPRDCTCFATPTACA